jgi:hypothetical protein
MALIRFAEGQQRSGSIGATVYSRNRSGAYVRARTVPVNPQSPLQVAARNRVQNLTIDWQTVLTEDQRAAWKWYAENVDWINKLGDSIHLTGMNHYLRSNAARQQAGLTQLDDAPIIPLIAPAEEALVATGSEATQQLSVAFDDTAPWCDLDGAFQLVFMGSPQNAGIQFFGGPYRYAGVILGNSTTPPTSPAAIAASFPIFAGQKVWVRTRIGLDDGRLSELTLANFLCAA